MTYCFNSRCTKPQNPDHARFCHHCGSPLQLVQRFSALAPLGHSGKTLLARDEQLPSQPHCLVLRGGDDTQQILRWSHASLLRLEALSQQSRLPKLLAVVTQPMKGATRHAQFLVHEWIEAETVADDLAARGPWTAAQVTQLMRQALQGLAELHEQQVIYGDLRPKTLAWAKPTVAKSPAEKPSSLGSQNLSQSGDDDRALVFLSYGALTFMDDPAATHHSPQGSVAERSYRAPEFLRQEGGAASDLYSLGLTAVELLTGLSPEQLLVAKSLSEEQTHQSASLLTDSSDWVKHAAHPVSEELQLIVQRLIQPRLEERFGSATEVLEALNELARSPLSRSEGTVSLVEKALACSLETSVSPDFSSENHGIDASSMPTEAQTEQAAVIQPKDEAIDPASDAALQAGEFQTVSISALVAALLDNPTKLPLGKLIAKMPLPTQGGSQSLSSEQSTLNNPRALWQQLQELQAQGYSARALADGWIELGKFYQQQVQQGSRNIIGIIIAIAAYEQALIHALEPMGNDDPAALSTPPTTDLAAYDQLGRLYWQLGRKEPKYRPQCLNASIRVYNDAIAQGSHGLILDPNDSEASAGEVQQDPSTEAQTQEQLASLYNHLGEAYNDVAIAHQEPEQWRLAIQAYQSAVKFNPIDDELLAERPSVDDPPEWLEQRLLAASTHNNLGTACWNLAQYESDDQAAHLLQQAIAAYNQAALIYDPDENAIRYGMIQNNLGTTYLNLGQIEQSLDLLRLAAGTYQVALIYRSRNEAPMSHATTQNNLGAACIQLAAHPYSDPIASREALEQAIAAYQAALTLVEELKAVGVSNFGFDPTAPQLNLGLAHQRIGMLSEDIQATGIQLEHLETAIDCYLTLIEQETQGSEVYGLVLEYLNQICHYLSDTVGLPSDHRLLKKLPDHLFVEMSQQIQQQISLQAAM